METQIKERHGCVSTYLILMIIFNFATIIFNIFYPRIIVKSLHYSSQSVIILYSAISALNVLFAFMLLKWKKWAFFGSVITTLLGAALNFFITENIFTSILGLLGIAFMYGMLQIKKDNVAAWDNLE